jgi:cell division protein FtsX
MRLSADTRASELRVLRLMGANGVLSHGPNLIEGAFLGGMGAVLAIVSLWFAFQAGAPVIADALSTSTLGQTEFDFLGVRDLLQLALFGLSLGLVGGLVTNYSQAQP